MAGALGLVITTDVPVVGSHAIPVYVDDTLPIVGPSRACVISNGDIPFAGGPPLAVRLAPAGTPAVGPALPVYVVPGGGSLGGAAAIVYLLRDVFTTDRAPGAVNGTAAEPGPGTRVAVEVDGQFTIASGRLTFPAQASPVWGDQCLRYGAQTRALGRMLVGSLNLSTFSNCGFGWANSTTPATPSSWYDLGIDVSTATLVARYNGLQIVIVHTPLTTGTTYTFTLVLRAAGGWIFIEGGIYTVPTLLWVMTTNSTATLYPNVNNFGSVGAADDIAVPDTLYIPAPLAYDTFTRANGALGTSESSGPDAQTTPALAWTDQAGTWAIATNKATASALAAGLAQSTVPTSSADVLSDVAVTRAAGVAGMVLRYADASNYLLAYHDGTNAKLDQVVAGVTTNLKSAAQAYSAGATLRVVLAGTMGMLYYNNVFIGGASFTVPASSAAAHGLYTTDTGNSLDAFTVWART